MLIKDTKTLEEFCQSASLTPILSIDTEFYWRRTYLPKLSLIQMCTDNTMVAVDMLEEGIDFSMLSELLSNKSVLKVIHSGTQDLEIIRLKLNTVIEPIYDTQIAAAFCGLPLMSGYATLVEHVTGVQLDKSCQTTNWINRPLSEQQIQYALNDVKYLHELYQWSHQTAEQKGVIDWILAEMFSVHAFAFRKDTDHLWKAIKLESPTPESLGVLKQLCIWREDVAKKIDIPPTWYLTNKMLADIAQAQPRSKKELSSIPSITSRIVRTRGNTILEVVRKGQNNPNTVSNHKNIRNRTLTDLEKYIVNHLKELLRTRCNSIDISDTIVATSDEIRKLVMYNDLDQVYNLRIFQGWRREFFGTEALEVKKRILHENSYS